MIWLAIRIWAGKALGAAVGAFKAYPLQCAIIALACLSAWLWRGWGHEAAGRKDDAAKFAAAQVEAEAIGQRALAETERKYRSKADVADQKHAADMGRIHAVADRYIAQHRVRGPAQGSASQAAAPAASGGPGVSETVPADPFVVVLGSDVRACSVAVKYGIDAHDWAVGLNK
jgi:hypothetical protein